MQLDQIYTAVLTLL